ncbi:MAG: CopD family protein [Thermoproteota archaeon]|nr:CopD family protein [Thermoproteota archaeon]
MVLLIEGLVVWLHLVAASIWVGGSIFLGVILSPMLKRITKTVEERIVILIKVGRRFSYIAFPSLLVLVLTGIYNSKAFILDPDAFYQTSYGIILMIKIAAVVATFAAYILHIRIISTETEKDIISGNASTAFIHSIRSKIIFLGRVIVFLSILILLLAAFLDAGGLAN